MSEATTEAAADKHKHPPPSELHDEHDDHDHSKYPFLAHHFDTPEQQFEAGKLGIWLFLVTEVLFFAGLFCAYTLYRAQYPEVFYYAHFYLDTKLGALNTVVLLVSSLTAAWAVRCAQMRNKAGLVANIAITILCACTFMCVKYVEYSHKFHDGLLPGNRFHPHHQIWELETFQKKHPDAVKAIEHMQGLASGKVPPPPALAPKKPDEKLDVALAQRAYVRTVDKHTQKVLVDAGLVDPHTGNVTLRPPTRTATFFGIYFFMTGLHGLHVLIGIGIFIWLFFRARKGVFNENYFGPIDFAALYWHLVDLIWIYLFPLLYLIH